MLFRRNNGSDRHVWVDRGIDGRVDDFQVCEPCDDALAKYDPYGQRWHDMEKLCPNCRTGFTAHALAVDLFGLPRPFNGMLEDRLLTNDELEAGPRPPVPGAFNYFVPGVFVRTQSGQEDPFEPAPFDAFRPGPYDGSQLSPSDYFLPDPYDHLLQE